MASMQHESTHQGDGAPSETPGGDDEMTGDAAVDDVLRTLQGLETRPVHEHVAAIEDVHKVLQDRLAESPADDHDDGQG